MGQTAGKLTALKVQRLAEPGMHADGGGLYLQVTGVGAKSWIYRFALSGRAREMGIGPFSALGLAQAREKAARSMRRVMIMGPTGSGKSTLARRIGARYGLPVFHLDQAFHRPGWEPAPKEEFHAEVARIAALPSWVIDGNYTDTIEPRFHAADTLIYLDMPTWLTMARVLKRMLISYGRVRPDAAAGCPERLNLPFLEFAWNWNRE